VSRKDGFGWPRVEEKKMKFHQAVLRNCAVVCREFCAIALSLSLTGLAFGQQQQQGQPPPTQEQQQGQQQGQQQAQQQGQQTDRPPQSQDQPPQPPPPQSTDRPPQNQQPPQAQGQPAPPQNGNRPPISQDRIPQNPGGYGQQYPQSPNRPPSAYDPANGPDGYNPNDQYAPPPPLLTIPAGTVILTRLNEPLSSDHSQIGDQFTGTLQQPLVVNGFVVARRGQVVMGQVKSAKKAGRVTGTSQLGVELTDITLVDGEQAPILTELWKTTGGTTDGADAATIAGGTGLGAAIGAAADWGRGAAIGAGAGAVLGIGAVLLTRGRPTILEPESLLTFRLVDPVKVDTTHSQQAFLPVSQEDFGGGRGDRPRLRTPGNGYYGEAYGPAPCGYSYPCYYGPAYVGVYPGFGWWGPGFYGRGWYGPRGFRRF
jgi:hypothetical protein